MKITDCKVNHLTNPIGFSIPSPVFSWKVTETTGKEQAAARIMIRCGDDPIADTGWAELDSLATSVLMTLRPRQRYYWTVSVCTDTGEEAQSQENWFETGKLDEPWVGKWISCDNSEPRHPIFTKQIAVKKGVVSARLYICGLGLYEAFWCGERIGNELLMPYCNHYNRWVQYQTYDVTRQVQSSGELSVHLGNGWYKGRFGFKGRQEPYYGDSWKLIAELRITYTDGTDEVIGTDDSWTVTRSNLTFSNIYDGEHRDDTLLPIPPVCAQLAEAPKGKLTERMSLPVTVQQVLPAKEFIHTPAGETVLDMGQLFTGSFRLKLHVPAGTKVHLQFGELLQNGNFYRDNLRSALAEYFYTSSGEEITLQPQFTFYGYRYVKITGVPNLRAEDFEGLVLYSEMEQVGHITTGHALVNQLISNALWGQKGNYLDVPTDCPQRDERMGWTGDAQVFAPTACFQMDSFAFLAKFLEDIWQEQQEKGGMVPDVVPSFDVDGCATAWGDAACVIPWVLYQYYGDISILQRQYPSMKAWVDYIQSIDRNDHSWRRHFHYGDWLALDGGTGMDGRIGRTDVGLIADTYYLYSTRLTAKTAELLGHPEDAKHYTNRAEHILTELRKDYFSPDGLCLVDTQTAYLLTLRHGLSSNVEGNALALVHAVENNNGHLHTGFVGTPILCEELTKIGRSDLAFDLLVNEDYPGWLYSVKLGATTVWERWNSVLPDGTISGTDMNSMNHYAYGSILQWMYERCAGFQTLEPGFRKIRIAPLIDRRLGFVCATYDSPAGKWECHWKLLEGNHLQVRIVVPFDCTAEVILPQGNDAAYKQLGGHRLSTGEYCVTYEVRNA